MPTLANRGLMRRATSAMYSGEESLRASPGEQQDVLQAHVRDGLGFVVGLFGAQVAARLLVVGVETAVTALVGAVVRHIERREQVHGRPK